MTPAPGLEQILAALAAQPGPQGPPAPILAGLSARQDLMQMFPWLGWGVPSLGAGGGGARGAQARTPSPSPTNQRRQLWQ